MPTNILEEFLVAVGVKVDEAGLTRLRSAVGAAGAAARGLTKELGEIGLASVAMATAVGVAVLKVNENLTDLYYMAQRTNVSATNLKAVGLAAKQVGISAESITGQLGALARTMRDNPLQGDWFKLRFGASGDPLQVLQGMVTRYHNLIVTLGENTRAGANAIALLRAEISRVVDPDLVRHLAIPENFPEFIKGIDHAKEVYKALGLELDSATGRSVKATRAWNELVTQLTAGWDKAIITLSPAFEKIFKALGQYIHEHSEDIKQITDDWAEWIASGEGATELNKILANTATILDDILKSAKWMAANPGVVGALLGGAIGLKTAGIPGGIVGTGLGYSIGTHGLAQNMQWLRGVPNPAPAPGAPPAAPPSVEEDAMRSTGSVWRWISNHPRLSTVLGGAGTGLAAGATMAPALGPLAPIAPFVGGALGAIGAETAYEKMTMTPDKEAWIKERREWERGRAFHQENRTFGQFIEQFKRAHPGTAAPYFQRGGIVPINAHAGEMVLPSHISDGLQGFFGRGNDGGVMRDMQQWVRGSSALRPYVQIAAMDRLLGLFDRGGGALFGTSEGARGGAPGGMSSGVGRMPGRVRMPGPAMRHSPGSGANLPQGENFDAATKMLTSLGVMPEVARGAMAYSYWNESGLNTKARNPTSGALGIFQWLGSRLTALTGQYGQQPDLKQQLEFAKSELLGKEGATLAALKEGKTQHEGYSIWGHMYERPAQSDLAKAEQTYLKHGGKIDIGPTPAPAMPAAATPATPTPAMPPVARTPLPPGTSFNSRGERISTEPFHMPPDQKARAQYMDRYIREHPTTWLTAPPPQLPANVTKPNVTINQHNTTNMHGAGDAAGRIARHTERTQAKLLRSAQQILR